MTNEKWVRAKKEGQRFIFIHNDLFGAAFHYKEVILQKLTKGDQEGLNFDCMACLTFLAFTNEAHLNFIGQEILAEWDERASYKKKLTAALDKLGAELDDEHRPLKTLSELKTLRNTLAHGKPIKETYSTIIEGKLDEIDRDIDLSTPWDKYCTPEFVEIAYEDTELFWKTLIETAGLEHWDTMTRGDGSLSIIEVIVDKNDTL